MGMHQLAGTLGLDLLDFCGALKAFVHGTTTADNTMIEMSGPITCLLATEGHRDEIELRRDAYGVPPGAFRSRVRGCADLRRDSARGGGEDPFTVVVLAPTDVAVLDEHGNYDITIGPA
jgi:N-methylhydantoinase A/oxoprolinase/acetone carboxylase beta subunit